MLIPVLPRVPVKQALGVVVAGLRRDIHDGAFNARYVTAATQVLAEHGYKYDISLFPPLPRKNWSVPTVVAPESLAEALLWKMGKWKIYESFVEHYDNPSSVAKNDVVFYGFAKHLADPEKPIYDQHALRALWAIDVGLTSEQAAICKRLLALRSGKWKPIISGVRASEGYDLYVERARKLAGFGVSLDDLDKLLMPLGQALKDATDDIVDFHSIARFEG